jgi:hypothetical protein
MYFMQPNCVAPLLNRAMRMDSVTSGVAWNSALTLLKIDFGQPNCVASLLNTGMPDDSATSGAALNSVLALLKI